MSVVFRNGTVLTVDAGRTVLSGHDVLVTGDRIAAVGVGLEVPEGTEEVDATGGIVMPGMVDTHRHMWQTSLRGYGADWTLTQYFVWNYLEWGKIFRPEDIHAGNLLAALEALDAGVTTTVDWSHGLQTPQHADATVDALTGNSRVPSENLHSIVKRVRPAVESLLDTELRHDHDKLVAQSVRANVRSSVEHLSSGSPILESLISEGKLMVVGAEYSLETGKVDFFYEDYWERTRNLEK